MIYVPMLKTRTMEMNVLKDSAVYLSNNMIPLIEVILEKYQTRYKVDENGEYVKEMRGSRYFKVKCEYTEEDIITLPYLKKIINDKKVFIDYFRYSLKKYGKNIDIKKAELSFNLNNNYELYKQKVFSVCNYDNMIPVISVKESYDISKKELISFLTSLQSKADHVALRITEEWLESFKDIISNNLRQQDYLLFDIGEQNPSSKFMEIEQLIDYSVACNTILLNSPRKLAINNGDYPEHDKTDLINNCARNIAYEYSLSGYGDYCGLKDKMPLNDGSNGKGAALALLYKFDENVFYSYCNHDRDLGMKASCII